MLKQLDNIIQSVRDLRDSPNHVCPNDTDDSLPCTCGTYDEVIDDLTALRAGVVNPDERTCPTCGSSDLELEDIEADQVNGTTHYMKCNDCGTKATEEYSQVFIGYGKIQKTT